jgi:hypothetical protein
VVVMVMEKAVMMVVVMMMMTEELREFDLRRLCLCASRLILAQHGDCVGNRGEQIRIARSRREFRLLRWCGLSARCDGQCSRRPEQPCNLLVHFALSSWKADDVPLAE